ncbi:MAG TPA: MerR family transcriptional regulator, partial [Clostridium sp.]|nr:MerR family transcriptional regulator [Clostridium sp.]
MDNYDIVIKKVEGFKAASVRDVVESYGEQSKLW